MGSPLASLQSWWQPSASARERGRAAPTDSGEWGDDCGENKAGQKGDGSEPGLSRFFSPALGIIHPLATEVTQLQVQTVPVRDTRTYFHLLHKILQPSAL